MTCIHRVALATLVAVAVAIPAAAQQNVTQTDIQRLQDNIYLAERDVAQLRGRDATRASRLTEELDELRDEVVYLKVKLRKERMLPRTEYADVRDRIEDVRTRARDEGNTAFSRPGSAAPAGSGVNRGRQTQTDTRTGNINEVPIGTEIDVRLQNSLNSGTAQVEDRFEGTTVNDVVVSGRVLIPAGSVVRGVVTGVEPATRTNRTARLTVSFDQVTVYGRSYPIRGTVTEALEGEGIRGEIGRTGAGAAVGGLLGAVLGGVKGAVIGAVIGGGGTIAATEGKEVELAQGAILRLRLDSPLEIQNAR